MLAKAGNVTGKSQEDATESIKQHQLFGADIEPWVSVIAKMNMYIHGDGKSNIRRANGLTLAAIPVFAPAINEAVVDKLDVIVTNPPLGDINFKEVSVEAVRFIAKSTNQKLSEKKLIMKAGEWSRDVFRVVPHYIKEEREAKIAKDKIRDYIAKGITAELEGDIRGLERVRKLEAEWSAKQQVAEIALGSGDITYISAGSMSKGGVLFISALVNTLKKVRDGALPLEWRGGVLGLVIDDAVLNTREYSGARAFIRRHFFVKAVLSLPRDAFKDLAKTTAKTSIILLIRKADADVAQREPAFFARALKTGPASNDLTRANDLIPICDAFDRWRAAVIEACGPSKGALPSAKLDACVVAMRLGAPASLQVTVRALNSTSQTERLDEAYWCMRDIVAGMPNAVSLKDVADIVSADRTPDEQEVYAFAYVSRLDARVQPKREATTSYKPSDLRVLKEGDILISGIDFVYGAVGVVGPDCDGKVVSKEYYIVRPRVGVEAHWLVSLLRTPAMRRIVEGMTTGISNRTRVESSDMLMDLPVPEIPDPSVQKKIGDALRSAHAAYQQMLDDLKQAETQAAKSGGMSALISAEDEPEMEA